MRINLKKTEAETLKTFKKHRPSEYFSHLANEKYFQEHDSKVENLYRFGLTFPPEMFAGKKLIDLGAGTGEHTVSLARWGAHCTLVEMNDDAVEIAKKNFKQHTKEYNNHHFINSSLYDIDLQNLEEKFDISHSRGVFTHVADKRKAFKILASLAKPGGYVIFGDRNTCGGIQEMLQRLAIYKLGGISDEKIVEISEILFSEDIDRSQQSVPRTREAIIFDRWVIQQQDDPSVDDVLSMFQAESLEYVSSWPRIDFPGRGTSTFSDPRNSEALRRGARIIENLWVILQQGELENINLIGGQAGDYFEKLASMAGGLRNLQKGTSPNIGKLQKDLSQLAEASDLAWGGPSLINKRLQVFFSETIKFLGMVASGESPAKIRKAIDGFSILFKGFAGVRHVDYVAYKRK